MTCSCQSGKQFLFFFFRPRHRHLARSLNAVMAVLTRVQDGPGVVGVKMSDCAHCSVIVLVFVLAFVFVFALVFVLIHVCTVSECHLICAFCSHLRLYVSVGDDDRAAMLSHGVV